MKMRMWQAAALTAVIGTVPLMAQQGDSASAPITLQQLRDGLKDPSRWLIYGGDYSAKRFSPLTQLTPRPRSPSPSGRPAS